MNGSGARVRYKLTAGGVVRTLEYTFLALCYTGTHNNNMRCSCPELVRGDIWHGTQGARRKYTFRERCTTLQSNPGPTAATAYFCRTL